MSGHKKQHFIPRCYLKAWCDPDSPQNHTPYVWIFDKDGKESRKKAPENIFYEKDMYTIEKVDGERDLVLEHGLQQLETDFAAIRNRKLKRRRPLDIVERIQVCAFIAAMQGRTRVNREHHRRQWERPFKIMEEMMEWAKTATPEEKKRAAGMLPPSSSSRGSLNYEQVRALVENPLQEMLFLIIRTATPLLCKLDFAIFDATDDPGFITSDHPCVWYDPEAYKRPLLYRAPALMYKTIEITLPISPQQCICLNRQGINGHLAVNEQILDELNRRTRFEADEYFVVCRNCKKDIWFDPGVEPEDSWEKMQKRKVTETSDS